MIVLSSLAVAVSVGSANLFPDQVYALYSGSTYCLNRVCFELERWGAAVIGFHEAFPAPDLPTPMPIVAEAIRPHDPPRALWSGHFLREARSLQALPPGVRNALGGSVAGPEGIADRGEYYSTGCVRDPWFPGRRFVVAGVDGDSVLVAVEHGGIAWGVDATLYTNTSGVPVARRTWGLSKRLKTLQELVKAVPPL